MDDKEFLFLLIHLHLYANEKGFIDFALTKDKFKDIVSIYPRSLSYDELSAFVIADSANSYYKDIENPNDDEKLIVELLNSHTHEEFQQIVLKSGIESIIYIIKNVPLNFSINEAESNIIKSLAITLYNKSLKKQGDNHA